MTKQQKSEALKQRRREYALRYYYENREEVKARAKARREADPEANRRYQREYKKANPDKVKQWKLNAARKLLERERIERGNENHKQDELATGNR